MLGVFFIIGSYLMGSIPFAYLLLKFKGIDPRYEGSLNVGANNARRLAGAKIGFLVLAGDFFKGFFAVFLTDFILNDLFISLLAGFAAFLGHLYPIFLKFKGGKGVATFLGIFLYFSPIAVVLAVLVYLILMFSTKTASVSSIGASLSIFVFLIIRGEPKMMVLLALFLSLIIVFKHKDNIKRIISKEEDKVF